MTALADNTSWQSLDSNPITSAIRRVLLGPTDQGQPPYGLGESPTEHMPRAEPSYGLGESSIEHSMPGTGQSPQGATNSNPVLHAIGQVLMGLVGAGSPVQGSATPADPSQGSTTPQQVPQMPQTGDTNPYDILALQQLMGGTEKPKERTWSDTGKDLMAPLAVGLLSSLVYPRYGGRAAGIGQGINAGINLWEQQQQQRIAAQTAERANTLRRASTLAKMGSNVSMEKLRQAQIEQTGELGRSRIAEQTQAAADRHADSQARIAEAAEAAKQRSMDYRFSVQQRADAAQQHNELMKALTQMRVGATERGQDIRAGTVAAQMAQKDPLIQAQTDALHAKTAALYGAGSPEEKAALSQFYQDNGYPAASRAIQGGANAALVNKAMAGMTNAQNAETRAETASTQIEKLKQDEQSGPRLAQVLRNQGFPDLADAALSGVPAKDLVATMRAITRQEQGEKKLQQGDVRLGQEEVKLGQGERKLDQGDTRLGQGDRRLDQDAQRVKVLQDNSKWAEQHKQLHDEIAVRDAEVKEAREKYSESTAKFKEQEANHKAEQWEREKQESITAAPMYRALADKGNKTAEVIANNLDNGALLSDPSMKPLVTAMQKTSGVQAPVKVINLQTGLSENVPRSEALDNDRYRPWSAQAEKSITTMKTADAAIGGLKESLHEMKDVPDSSPAQKMWDYYVKYKAFGGLGLTDAEMNKMSWTDLAQQQILGMAGALSGSRAASILMMITNHIPKQQDSKKTIESKLRTMTLAMDLAKDAAGYGEGMISDPAQLAAAKQQMGLSKGASQKEYEEKFGKYLSGVAPDVIVNGERMTRTQFDEGRKKGTIPNNADIQVVE